ncbi:MAG: hypothetical protein QOE14_1853 [Humisphaera sp.]|nr:hypothetical protein [Humisphaera sp.]
MRLISTIALITLAASLSGCISYHRHEREERVVEHRSGSYRVERAHDHGGYDRRPYRGGRHDRYRH